MTMKRLKLPISVSMFFLGDILAPVALTHAAELVIKEGKGHGWSGQDQDVKLFADWYDKYLR